MVNILLEGYDIKAPWLYDELKNYINSNHTVAVVAFSFRDTLVKSLSDWNRLYKRDNGRLYNAIVEGLAAYGIPEDYISFVNYFADTKESAKEIIKNADIIYFPGGLPDKMMDRMSEFSLKEVLSEHKGVVMGYSAGALIQLAEYHVSPDRDYPEMKYFEGVPYLNDFFLEVHYKGTQAQEATIQKVLEEKGKTVYATALMAGAIVVDNGNVKLLGDVRKFG